MFVYFVLCAVYDRFMPQITYNQKYGGLARTGACVHMVYNDMFFEYVWEPRVCANSDLYLCQFRK